MSINRKAALLVFTLWVAAHSQQAAGEEEPAPPPTLHVARCTDFQVTGFGNAAAWKQAKWVALNRRSGPEPAYESRFKMLYSHTGVYVLFQGADQKLTATIQKDFEDLWNEDVFECFFWTNESDPVYFEYEISPLGRELPILVPNLNGQFLGWRPWHYEGQRKIQKKVTISGGPQKPHARITGWRAEVFIPYELLKPLRNVPPERGTRWRANIYRMDYDHKPTASWDWARVGNSFHEHKKFGTLIFD